MQRYPLGYAVQIAVLRHFAGTLAAAEQPPPKAFECLSETLNVQATCDVQSAAHAMTSPEHFARLCQSASRSKVEEWA